MPSTLGVPARDYISSYEEDKLAMEFAASAPILKGQLVKLDDAGTISPWINTDLQHKCIGFALKTITADAISIGGAGPAGPLVTVITRGYGLIYGLTTAINSDLKAGPTTCTGASIVSGLTDYCEYIVAMDVTDAIGWTPDETTTASTIIRVIIKD